MNVLAKLVSLSKTALVQSDPHLDYHLAKSIQLLRQSSTVTAANDEIALENWTEFETWFHKNRAQGLEFVFEDKYGSDSAETGAVTQLVEGYDLMERKLHELYVRLRGDAVESGDSEALGEEPAAEEEPVVEADEEIVEESPEDVAAEESEASDGELDEAVSALEELAGGESEEATDEEPAAEDEAVEEVVEEAAEETTEEEAPAKEASARSVTKEQRTVTKVTKMLRRASVQADAVMFRGNDVYSIRCANAAIASQVGGIVGKMKWAYTTEDHPKGHSLVNVTIRSR